MSPIAQAAIIFLPTSVDLDSTLAAHCLEHIARRGYRLLTVARDWPIVEQLLRAGSAQVVVFARRSHVDPDWAPRFEFVGEDTRDDVAGRRRPRNEREHRPDVNRPHLL